jgi:2-keto-3-deoxy-galactonokinase
MPGSTFKLSVDEQQATTGAAAAKRKEDDATVMAQATNATTHQEQEALIAAMATARKTLDEARSYEHATALAWEKEKTIACHLEQRLTATQGIVIPQDDDDDRSINIGSNPDAAFIAHLHA